MRISKAQTTARVHALPQLQFEPQRLTAFSGLVLVQALLQQVDLKGRLRRALGAEGNKGAYGLAQIVVHLVVHLLLGFRCLRDRDLYAKDPLVLRTLGLRRLPDVATMSRQLATAPAPQVLAVQRLLRTLVLERLGKEQFPRLTLDFDGTVLSTRRHAEGTAVGYNPGRKGERSYYPLLGTVAQTGQFLDFAHRPGNVHDSKGARDFIRDSFEAVKATLPRAKLEARMDSAFFDEKILNTLAAQKVEFTISVPLERLPQLKQILEQQKDWLPIDEQWSYASTSWQPASWTSVFRFVLLRRRSLVQRKGPLQLDLFVPRDRVYEYKVLVTNKRSSAAAALFFHNGRGRQEALIGEAKDACALGYVPQRRRGANQLFLSAALLAHNLGREMQMRAAPRHRGSEPQRPTLWRFETLKYLRDRLLLRPGRLTQPQGLLTLTLSGDSKIQQAFQRYLAPLLGSRPTAPPAPSTL